MTHKKHIIYDTDYYEYQERKSDLRVARIFGFLFGFLLALLICLIFNYFEGWERLIQK
ncbi:MAG: hypothetical protein RLZZ540_2238 [Bacteroidota bacterium]|jgi:hypothetical protein